MLPNAETLAGEFDRLLRAELTASEYRETIRRNRTPEYAGDCCASHDFTDANCIMLSALSGLSGIDESELVRTMFADDDAGMLSPAERHRVCRDADLLTLWESAWDAWHRSTGKLPPLPPSDADPATGIPYGDLT